MEINMSSSDICYLLRCQVTLTCQCQGARLLHRHQQTRPHHLPPHHPGHHPGLGRLERNLYQTSDCQTVQLFN